jgi:hypothetical protein
MNWFINICAIFLPFFYRAVLIINLLRRAFFTPMRFSRKRKTGKSTVSFCFSKKKRNKERKRYLF